MLLVGNREKIKYFLFRIGAGCLSALFIILLLELSLRIYVYFTRGSLALKMDHQLGWVTKPNYKFTGSRTVYDKNQTYKVEITTNKYGFRRWGNPNSERKKVFVVGDSFTMAMYASDGKAYYSVMGEELNMEVFAYGCSGYGTLQEYMIIDKYIDIIKPDILIVQFCFNDYENNYDTGRYDPIENVYARPYLKDGRIVINKSFLTVFKNLCGNHSLLAYFAITRTREFAGKFRNKNISLNENNIEKSYRESVEVTRQLFKMIKKRTEGKSRLTVMPLSCQGKFYADIKVICSDLNILCVTGIDEALAKADGNTLAMRAADGVHLNEKGEMLVGSTLADWMKNSLSFN